MARTRVKSLGNAANSKSKKAAYLINGDADPNASSRVFLCLFLEK
jgi:hypothetical protein